ncbi:MAG TPA: hypothetical protein VGH30_07635 [Jatrophihabitantaceae bacterium]|jgi:hypothetical protein
MDERIVLARRIAPTLVGMNIDEVHRLIASTGELRVRELAAGQGYEQSLLFGYVTVVVADQVVVDAWAG